MSREVWVWSKERQKLVRKGEFDLTGAKGRGVIVIKDIDPYKAVAADKETGTRPIIGGRRQHREFLRRNGYVELNDMPNNRTPGDSSTKQERVEAIKRAMGE